MDATRVMTTRPEFLPAWEHFYALECAITLGVFKSAKRIIKGRNRNNHAAY
jgi:hypothetical protein